MVSFFSDVTVSIEGDGLYGRYKVPFHQGHGKRNPPLPQAKNQTHSQGLFSFLPLERERETKSPASGEVWKRHPDKEIEPQPLRLKNFDSFRFHKFQLIQLSFCLMGFLWFLLALFFFSVRSLLFSSRFPHLYYYDYHSSCSLFSVCYFPLVE